MIIPVNAFEKGAHFSFGSSRLLFKKVKGSVPFAYYYYLRSGMSDARSSCISDESHACIWGYD